MNEAFVYPKPPYDTPRKMEGQYLRAWFGPKLVIVGSAARRLAGRVNPGTGWIEGPEETQADPTTFTAALAKVGLPFFALDLRTGDQLPGIRDALTAPWPFQLLLGFQSFGPREAFDAIVFFDRITAAKLIR
jgi:hypothetical protein